MALAAAEALAAVRRDKGNIRALIAAGEALFTGGSREAALELLRAGVALVPDNAAALRVLSGFLTASGAADEAEMYARRAVALAPAQAELQLHLAHVLFARRRHAQAAPPLLAVLARQPENAAAWHMLSVALLQSGQPARAVEASGRATALAPDNVEYALHRAAVLNARACHGDALAELRRAAALAPEEARIAGALSGVLEVLGQLPAAQAEAERACRLAPESAEMAGRLAALRERLGLLNAPVAPPAWPPAARQSRRRAAPSGMKALVAERGRIIWAIVLREMRTRHSRSALGYLWALAEPVSHLLTLGVMFAYINREPPPVGDSLFEFYCTGLLPYLLFAHVSTELMHTRAAAGALLLLPRVRSTDIMLARTFLQLMTEITVIGLVFSAFGLAGYRTLPAQPLTALAALLLLTLLGLGAGAVNMILLNYFSGWDTIYNAIVRLLYFASGIYFTPIAMPDAVRDALVWNPVLQGVELFRTGFFPDYAPFWLNTPYLVCWTFGLLAFGLSLERALRRVLKAGS